jgi:TonB-dependent receptor
MTQRKISHACVLLRQASWIALAAAGTLALSANAAQAQTTAPAPNDTAAVEEVVVTGYRAALESALNLKRRSNVMIDAINAEDIADFPDANLAESLQRLPGVSIDRDNGEGRTITVRGLGSDFTRVRLNGLEALSTAGANDSGTSPNRSRGFDFSVFASELFSSLQVRKTQSAETDEGSLGATVDLITGRPLNFKGRRLALSLQDAYYENGGHHSPRVAALVSDRWDTNWGQFGALFSLAYNKRKQTTDSYLRNPGVSDYTYRQSPFNTTPNPTASAANPSVSTQNRMGFAAPTGTVCNGVTGGLNGLVPGLNVTNLGACASMIGSNPAAYALINNPIGQTLTTVRTPVLDANGVPTGAFTNVTTTTGPGSLIRIPALATLNQQQLEQDRLGMNLALQWRPTDRTTVSVDGVYSRFYNDSQNFQISTVGLNRRGAAVGYQTATAATTPATRRGFYDTCVQRDATPILGGIDCGQSLNGTTPVAGTVASFNPNNLEPYDYYNSPNSVGYIAPGQPGYDPLGMSYRNALIGRNSTYLIDAALSPGGQNADYLKLGNIDVRSADDQQTYTTFFQQGSINIEHEFSDRLKVVALYGRSRSVNKSTGLLTEYNRLDSGKGVAGNDYLIYDARGDGEMPLLNFGFDTANPANWDFVKGYSAVRVFKRVADNHYEGGKFDLSYEADDNLTVKVGFNQRKYRFETTQYRRTGTETINPSLKEAGSSVAATSRTISWGKGLDVPTGTPTSFIAPDNQKFLDLLDFDCNCINKWGDWRTSYQTNASETYSVDETDTGAYVQFDGNAEVFDRTLRGNFGIRYAQTEVEANGLTNTSRAVSATNKYHDILPALNLAYEVSDRMMIRFGAAKVMARPLLGNLAPSITAFSVPTTAGVTDGGGITLGNPKLAPFRAINYDLSFEWYFAQGALFSVAVFDKDISSFPQTVIGAGPLTSILDSAAIAELRASQTNVNSLAYIDANNAFNIRQFRDAPGGYIRGVELSYQQNLTFLPWFLDKLGVQANYTHLESELQYIIDPGAPAVKNAAGVVTTPARALIAAPGPWTGASPDAFNFTVYYDTGKWSARVSTAYRAKYYTTYPIASGTCDPGFCDSPLVNDFVGSKATTNVDFSASYKFTKNVSVNVEALNLTNQTSNRFGYAEDPVVTQYGSTGRQVFVGMRMVF